jgi:hypothetical protein
VRDDGFSVEAEHNHNLTRQLDVMQPMWGDAHTQGNSKGQPQIVFKRAALTITLVENDDSTHYTMELNGPTQ